MEKCIETKYQIVIPGEVHSPYFNIVTLDTSFKESSQGGQVFSILEGMFDQDGIYIFLRRLYAMGLPLIAVIRLGK